MSEKVPKCKITVLKRTRFADLADEYRLDGAPPCGLFIEGQEFIIRNWERPAEFSCDWAWNDLYKIYVSLMVGGSYGAWMKNERSYIACCTDGARPVIFKLEMMDD